MGMPEAIAPDGLGGAWVAADTTQAWPYGTMFAAHVSAAGIMGPKVVLGSSDYYGSATATSDGSGGVFVVYRSMEAPDYGTGLRIQHIGADNALKLAPGGLLLHGASTDRFASLESCTDGHGGVFVSWTRYPSSGGGSSAYLVHVASTGELVGPAKDLPPGVVTSIGPRIEHILSDGVDRVRAIWIGPGANSAPAILMQRLDANCAPMWPSDVTVSGYASSKYVIMNSGGGEVIVGWSDGSASYLAIRAQRVGVDGSLRWPIGGVEVVRVPGNNIAQMAVASDGSGGAMIGYVDYIPFGQINSYIYYEAARVTADGVRAWPTPGFRFDADASFKTSLTAFPSFDGRVIFAWVDTRTPSGGSAYNIWAQLITPKGAFYAGAATGVPDGRAISSVHAWPQPAAGGVEMALPGDAGGSDVRLLDVAGRLVREWHVPAGSTRTSWDARDAKGALVPPGLYLARVKSSHGEQVARVVIAR